MTKEEIQKIEEMVRSLKELVNSPKDNFEDGLKNLIKSMTGIKDVSIRFLEWGINIYLNGYSICSVYHNKHFEVTKTVFYKYDLYFSNTKNYKRFVEVLESLRHLNMSKIEDFIQLNYLNPKKG